MSGGDRKHVTSHDVADLAGVSRATVSYVMNGDKRNKVSAATAQVVRAVAQSIGYNPSANARALRSGKSNVILLVIPSWDVGPTPPQAFTKLSSSLAKHGYMLVFHTSGEGTALNELWKFITPTLILATDEDLRSQLIDDFHSNVTIANIDLPRFVRDAGILQATYLAEQGHRRLGYLLPDHYLPEFLVRPRIEAIRLVAEQFGLDEPVSLSVEYSADGIESLRRNWLDIADPITGICAHTDEVAAFVYASSPNRFNNSETSLIGMSNRPIANVGITSVDVDIDVWASAWEETALAAIEQRDPDPEKTARVATRVIVRGSA